MYFTIGLIKELDLEKSGNFSQVDLGQPWIIVNVDAYKWCFAQ